MQFHIAKKVQNFKKLLSYKRALLKYHNSKKFLNWNSEEFHLTKFLIDFHTMWHFKTFASLSHSLYVVTLGYQNSVHMLLKVFRAHM